tara:strand:+ start:59848 stop:60426 length:579 start_codon:yes stop_codon:yes gene_type:complete
MKALMVSMVLISSFIFSSDNPYETFLNYLDQSGGLKFELEFKQVQNDVSFNTEGNFYIVEKNHFFFDDEFRRIIFQDSLITTINKNYKQIIYDYSTPEDVNIFNILSGNSKSLLFDGHEIENDHYKIRFNFLNQELSGIILIKVKTGQPYTISLSSNNNFNTKIKISSIYKYDPKKLAKINLDNFEKIDFRE